MTRARYQKGSLKQITGRGGRKVWLFRWRGTAADGSRVARKLVVGSVKDLPNEKAARDRLQTLGSQHKPGSFGGSASAPVVFGAS